MNTTHRAYYRFFSFALLALMLTSGILIPAPPAAAALPAALLPPPPLAAPSTPALPTRTAPCDAPAAAIAAAQPDQSLPPGTLAGTLRTADGLPLAALRVILLREEQAIASTQSDAAGQFQFSDLPPATYRVQVYDPTGNGVDSFEDASATLAPQSEAGLRLTLTLPIVPDVPAAPATPPPPPAAPATPPTASDDPVLAQTGTITGVVTAADTGDPLQFVTVRVYDSDNDVVSSVTTAANGAYTLSDIEVGSYRIEFQPSAFANPTRLYAPQFYNNKATLATADPVTVAEDATTGGINAVLQRGADLTGVISTSDTLQPLGSVTVRLYDAEGEQVRTGNTNFTGVYSITGLAAGSYRIEFVPSFFSEYVREFHNNKATLATANPVALTLGNVTTINAALDRGAVITGTVTDAGSSVLLENIQVVAYDANDSVARSTNTTPDGTYLLGGLPTGDYRVEFDPPFNSPYLGEFHDNQPDLASATPLSLTVNTTTTIDAALDRGATLQGSVTDVDTDAPLQGISVRLYNAAGNQVTSRTTTATGAYSFTGLIAGDYRVEFDPPFNSPYLGEFHDNQPDLASATPLSLTLNTITTIDAALQRGASVVGTVRTRDTNAPLEDISVRLYNTNGNQVASRFTTATGAYSFTGLIAGDYRVEFRPNSDSPYLREFFNRKPSLSSADLLVLTPPLTVTANAQLERGGMITGRVTDPSNANLEDIDVTLLDDNGANVKSVATSNTGAYEIVGIAGGSYRVEFDPPANSPFLSEFYNNAAIIGASDLITVQVRTTTPNINAQLERGGVITGQVTAADTGAPLANVSVFAEERCGRGSASATTNSSGIFTLQGLPTGQYGVSFSPPLISGYVGEVYNNRPRFSSGDLIAVTAPNTTANINAALEPGGTVSGRITAADTGDGLRNVTVRLTSTSGGIDRTAAPINDTGVFTITGVASGTYTAFFEPNRFDSSDAAEYQAEYYNNARTSTAATPITVASSSSVPNINAALELGGVVNGAVTAADTRLPLNALEVELLDNTDQVVASDFFPTNGRYRFSGLAAGTYRLRYDPSSTVGVDERAYFGTTTATFNVTVPNTTTINTALQRGGQISGTVTTADTGKGLGAVIVEIFDSDGKLLDDFTSTLNDGSFISTALVSGTYTVRFNPRSGFSATENYLAEFYNQQPDQASATPITVTAPNITNGITATLQRGGSLRGEVQDAVTGVLLGGIDVDLYDAVTGEYIRTESTNRVGRYGFVGLADGQYKLGFDPQASECLAAYLPEFYNDKPDLATADILTIANGNTLNGLNAALQPAANIIGQVLAADTNAGLDDVTVRVLNAEGQTIASGFTDQSGNYATGGVRPGTYTVEFDPFTDGSAAFYVGQFFDNKLLRANADPVTIGTTPLGGINATLQRGGQISGTVIAADTNQPLRGVRVNILDPANGNQLVRSTTTDEAGNYRTPALPVGSYTVAFTPTGSAAAIYASTFFNGKPDAASADPVSVTVNTVTPNINASLPRSTIGTGIISGVVTGADTTQGVANVGVRVFDSDGTTVGVTNTSTTGAYSVTGLVSGTYRVGFEPPNGSNYRSQFFNNKLTLQEADPVAVADNATTANINAVLAVQLTGLTGVNLTGPATGEVGSRATFTAAVQPTNATPPFTYTWSATNQTPIPPSNNVNNASASIDLTWSADGQQTVAVTVTDRLGNAVNDTATIDISAGQVSQGFVINPNAATSVPITGTNGRQIGTLLFPQNSVPFTVELRYTVRQQPSRALPISQRNLGQVFQLTFFNVTTGQELPNFATTGAISVTFAFPAPTTAMLAAVPPSSVEIAALVGTAWADAAATCTPPSPYERVDGRISTSACSGREFALTGRNNLVYLPLIVRADPTRTTQR